MILWRILVFIFLASLLKYTITDENVDNALERAHYAEIAEEEERAFRIALNQLNVELV